MRDVISFASARARRHRLEQLVLARIDAGVRDSSEVCAGPEIAGLSAALARLQQRRDVLPFPVRGGIELRRASPVAPARTITREQAMKVWDRHGPNGSAYANRGDTDAEIDREIFEEWNLS